MSGQGYSVIQEVLQDALLQRDKPASAHTANAFAMLVIWTLFSTAFPPWLLVSAPVPPLQDTGSVAHIPRCGGFACFSARQVPSPYSCPSHANSYANKKG